MHRLSNAEIIIAL